jgi:DNA-directed RNA polymerase subunit omega|tara:strand:- start:326 stop:529 length:204 start_codon:yes stop_codon:yes gene_type:complete
MARISSQDAVAKIGNRYDLVLIATTRVRELKRGHAPLVKTNNKEVVTALMEIEQGKIGREYLLKIKK